jgi:hypothetical protein
MDGHFAVEFDETNYFRRIWTLPASRSFRAKCRVNIDLNSGQ